MELSKRILTAGLIVAATVSLSSCQFEQPNTSNSQDTGTPSSEPAEVDETLPAAEVMPGGKYDDISVIIQQLPDGREVTCLSLEVSRLGGNPGLGLSCDWESISPANQTNTTTEMEN